MLDFEVMFDNARYYNEEDSQVYQVQLYNKQNIFDQKIYVNHHSTAIIIGETQIYVGMAQLGLLPLFDFQLVPYTLQCVWL